MKAIHLTSFIQDTTTELQPTDIPTPTPRSPDEILVRITHCSPQHADILHARGQHQNNNRKKGWLFPPFVLGFDFSGVVVSSCPIPDYGSAATTEGNRQRKSDDHYEDYSGSISSHGGKASGASAMAATRRSFQPGDRVFGASIGAFAEYIVVKSSAIRKIPSRLSNFDACAASGQAVSYAAVVHVARVRAGETVLVSGATGGLGGMCCSVAKAVGAKVIALTGGLEKSERVKEEMSDAVDRVIVTDQTGKWKDEVLEFTGGKGVDVVLDNTGMVNDAIRCLDYFGRVVILGFAARKGIMEEVKMNKLLLKSATVIGYRFGESGRRFPDELERIWLGYLEMLESGRVKTHTMGNYDGLESVGRALKDLEERKIVGKVVVKVADEMEMAKL